MNRPRLATILMLSTALSVPTLAQAQDTPATAPGAAAVAPGAGPEAPPAAPETAPAAPDVSIPGGDIVVTGRRDRNIVRAAPQVVSVLSTAEIARTGEGNIAGALGRVTGLSVVGSGFVYVRGLGDRYSLALLNGLPLPSPEPLRRVVPLDLFPSSIIASSLVQKSYSPNFPGEFGGGVINLTTKSIPTEGFLSIGAGISGDTETTGTLGYTYYGSAIDWTGFTNGNRDTPSALQAYFNSGARISSGTVDTKAIASQLVNGRNGLVQRWKDMPPNFTGSLSAGKSFDLGGDTTLGVIFTAGYNNRWTTRDVTNQTSLSSDLSQVENDFRRVITDNRVVLNALLGAGLEFGNNKVRWTNLYIRDTLKNTRLGLGRRLGTSTTSEFMQQYTAWYERQLIDTQLVGEFKLTPELSLDLRGTYANSQREAPGELELEYARTNSATDPFGRFFVNRLNNGNRGDATISYSDLNEDLWAGGADLAYKITPDVTATVGYAYSDTKRTSSRRDFVFTAPNSLPQGVDMLRPDLLLSPNVINNFNITLTETNEVNPSFLAKLENHAGYAKIDFHFSDALQLDAGVRYETAKETVSPVQVFSTPGASLAGTNLDNDYWLPAATLTWHVRPDLQVRLNASKTIARPQFRELIYQFYFDPDSNRQYRGNPLLNDSKLTNAEARLEYYSGRDDRISAAGFYKRIKNPIESFVDRDFTTSFANAPKADLYGGEFELQRSYSIARWGGDFFAGRKLVLVGNYTYTSSKLSVKDGDPVTVFASTSTNASDFFRDGAPLTGQAKHLVNLQVGIEDADSLSQQTILLSYASNRVVSRGVNNSGQPDIVEKPGIRLDFVARQGIQVIGKQVELKFEARNLTGTRHQEYQQVGQNRLDFNTYDVGRVFSLSAQLSF